MRKLLLTIFAFDFLLSVIDIGLFNLLPKELEHKENITTNYSEMFNIMEPNIPEVIQNI
jgi:hypothetical protein